jgi:type I phosphodiesterase/nucleotide pyrophosphatase
VRVWICAALALLALAAPASADVNKVLVIGTDGTRWDLLQQQMRAGKADNMARLAKRGFGRPSTLLYGPNTLTLSEVGWSSIASGVWEDKHGVDGTKLNMDPGQATKNGYLDFLTRVERARPRLNTYLASDWDNIGLPLNGGPIFGTAMDVNFAARVPAETIENWDRGDIAVMKAAERRLRHGDPDVSFVYLGVVDETAHLAGSATPTYTDAIATTDGRIGRLLRAIRARPSYAFESWTILVVTDHGERPLSEPSLVAHFGKTELELTSFVLGSGPGLTARVRRPLVVDINPTVLHQVGVPVKRSWNLDGHSLSKAKPPSSATARLRGHRLTARLRLGAAPRTRKLTLRLPSRVRSVTAVRLNGRPAGATAEGRTVTVSVRGRLRELPLAAEVAGRGGGSLTFAVRGGKLAVPIR